ncbi:hypothetical protein GWK47_025339 [Chionoecetes opilio]|uniref:Uncharacterized protein n=1 Tax=Chionoecetes opilio TaxID=41210 RepID=A0A8J8WB39_CHIOP|nr:hypothetical protein GWK47_025339 [Chionoecetes opilio]
MLFSGARAGPAITLCYTEQNLNGYYLNFDNYAPDLYTYNFDNVIDSVKQTGMWIYYENVNYNLSPGKVYFVHGIDITVNFPAEYSDVTSSLRFVGSLEELNGDTITFYEGNSFTASEYFTLVDASSFGQMSGKISSVIVTGRNPWTIYSGEGFSGDRLCVYPNTDSDHVHDQYLDLGIFPNSQSLGVPDNSIRSVKKGCWTERVAKAPKLAMDGRQENGAWGRLV